MNLSRNIVFIGLTIAIGTISSCKNDSETKVYPPKAKETSNKLFNTSFDGKLYSIPSPAQTLLLINALEIPFDTLLLHSKKEASQCKRNTTQALNLGIYWTDLAYIATNNQSKEYLYFLDSVKYLAKMLEIDNVFNPSFTHQFHNNIETQNSLLITLNSHFCKADLLLKESDRKNISALILTGCWIKSMYITSQLFQEHNNQELLQHLVMQKESLKTVLELMQKYNIDGQNDQYIHLFTELNGLYDKVDVNYEFISSITNQRNKTTTFSNNINIDVSEEFTNQIVKHISDTYTLIISS